MSIFKRTKKPAFTGAEITQMVMLASVVDLEKLELAPNPEMIAVIAKAKSIVVYTQGNNGHFSLYCPPIRIV